MQNMPGGTPSNNRRRTDGVYMQRGVPKNQPRNLPQRRQSAVPTRPRQMTTEHIRPMNPAYSRARAAQVQPKNTARPMPKKPPARKKKYTVGRSKLSDFFFGFIIGLVIFGIAAIIICNALIGLLA